MYITQFLFDRVVREQKCKTINFESNTPGIDIVDESESGGGTVNHGVILKTSPGEILSESVSL